MPQKILIVDDASLFLDLAAKILEPTGAQLFTTRSGIEALKIVEQERPDLVILDLVMPEISGDKVCMQIKANPSTADIPVIMVTSRGRPEELERCRRAGCDDFLTKPVKAEILREKISQITKRPHRHSLQVLVRLENTDQKGRHVHFGRSTDISKSGIGIVLEKKFELGQIFSLRFFISTSNEELLLNGRVVRREQQGSHFLHGIQFLDVTPQQQEVLAAFFLAKRK